MQIVTVIKIYAFSGIRLLLLGISFLFLSGCKLPQTNERLHLAVASNMQYAIAELTKEFTKASGIECEVSIGASGQLYAQILEGAPYDVFISADMTYPQAVQKAGMAAGSPKIYAYGKIVIWTGTEGVQPTFDGLKNGKVAHVAVANPRLAPYGMAALQTLKFHDVYRDIKAKLVYGENISQTHQFIASGAAEVGITAKSIVLSPEIKGKGNYTNIDENTYDPIAQGMVIITDTNPDYSKEIRFVNFLTSDPAKMILHRYGYGIHE